MRIAVIGDVHGNIYAFERVAADFNEQGVDSVVFLGDIAFLGLYPQECFDLLVSLKPRIAIKGNTDANLEELAAFVPENAFERRLREMIVYTDGKMTSSAKRMIRSWHIAERDTVDGVETIFCHGSPYSFKDHLSEENKEQFAMRIQQENVPVVFCGHTHKRMKFRIAGTDIVNFGAVGYSFDGNTNAHYGIIDFDKGISHEFREVSYDIERYKEDVRKQKPVFMDNLLYALENGLPRPM